MNYNLLSFHQIFRTTHFKPFYQRLSVKLGSQKVLIFKIFLGIFNFLIGSVVLSHKLNFFITHILITTA